MSSDASNPIRKTITVCLLLAAAVAGYFIYRPATDEQPLGTKEQYLAALEPVLSDAQEISRRLTDAAPGPELFDAVSQLETAWAAVRTGPGYDRQTHDSFIIAFGSYVTRLKSAGMIWKSLDAEPRQLEGKKTQLLFTLQSLHGAETAAQLMSKRGLTVEALLSKTNLNFEVTNSLAQAPAVLDGALELYEQLPRTNPDQ